jgi:hypothetical protein
VRTIIWSAGTDPPPENPGGSCTTIDGAGALVVAGAGNPSCASPRPLVVEEEEQETKSIKIINPLKITASFFMSYLLTGQAGNPK